MDNHNSFEEFQNFLLAKGLLPYTILQYNRYFKMFSENLNELSKEYCLKFLSKNNNPVCRAFISNYLDFVNRLDIRLPKVTGNKNKKVDIVEYISREEINRIMESMLKGNNPKRNFLMLAISFQGALRIDELLHLTPMSFKWEDWKENTDLLLKVIVLGKRNKKRIIYINSDIAHILRDYITALQTHVTVESDDLLFRANKLGGIGGRRWETILEVESIKAIGKRIHPHMLRHSFAMYAKDELGWTLEKISKYLGHDSLQTTLIYSKTSDKELAKSFDEGFNQSD